MRVLLAGGTVSTSSSSSIGSDGGWMDASYAVYELQTFSWLGKPNHNHNTDTTGATGTTSGVDSMGNPVVLIKGGTLEIGSAGSDTMCLQPGCYIGGIVPSTLHTSINAGLMW